jgi:hypothetical protein
MEERSLQYVVVDSSSSTVFFDGRTDTMSFAVETFDDSGEEE